MKIIDSPTRRTLPARQGPIRAFVLHTTGDSDRNRILAFYRSNDGLQPGYFIQTDGLIHRIVDDGKRAYHCKIEDQEADLYAKGWNVWNRWVWKKDRAMAMPEPFTGYQQWRSSWPGLQSPLELVTGRHPNSVSIGVEMQQPETPTAQNFTDDQYTAVQELLRMLAQRHDVPLDRKHVLGHYDCSPMRRSTSKGAWDPPASFSFERVLGG